MNLRRRLMLKSSNRFESKRKRLFLSIFYELLIVLFLSHAFYLAPFCVTGRNYVEKASRLDMLFELRGRRRYDCEHTHREAADRYNATKIETVKHLGRR